MSVHTKPTSRGARKPLHRPEPPLHHQDFVARYQAGDYGVWDELAAQHQAVSTDPNCTRKPWEWRGC